MEFYCTTSLSLVNAQRKMHRLFTDVSTIERHPLLLVKFCYLLGEEVILCAVVTRETVYGRLG